MSTNYSRQFQGPYVVYIAPAVEAIYDDLDHKDWPGIVESDSGTSWTLLCSGLQAPNGIRIAPQYETIEIEIDALQGPLTSFRNNNGYTIMVNMREWSPQGLGQIIGNSLVTTAAKNPDPKYVSIPLNFPNQSPQFSLYIAGRSTLNAHGAALWFPKVVVTSIGEFAISPQNPVEIPITFRSLYDTSHQHGKFIMASP